MIVAKSRRQPGFALITLVFLMVIGALLLAAMAFLYGTANTQQSLQNMGAQAFISAESGDQYGVYSLEQTTPAPTAAFTVTPPVDNPACPATVTISAPSSAVGNGNGNGNGNGQGPHAVADYTVTSVATCPSDDASWTVTRVVQESPGRLGKGNQGQGLGGRPGSGSTYQTISWAEN